MTEVLNGPEFVAWIEAHADLSGFRGTHPSQGRRILNWRSGGQADIGAADAILIALGLHLSMVPDHLFQPYVKTTGHHRAEALRLYRQGLGPAAIAGRLGVDPSTISCWAKEAGITRNPPRKKPA